jgi:hypothetical protein
LYLKPPRPLPDSWIAAMFQQPAQADQVEGVVLDAVILRMLKRMGIGRQETDCAVGRIAVLPRRDLIVECDLTFVRKSHVSNRNSDLRLGGFRPKFTGFQMVLLRQKLTSRRLSYEHPLGCTAAAS